jgi:Fic family protein
MFVCIHPYTDGNGRMGRFLMNAMLASGGHPWTVIDVARRDEYMRAPDAASSKGDIEPFASFIADCVAREAELRRAS